MERAFAPDAGGEASTEVIGVLSPHIEVLTYPARPETEVEESVRQRLDGPNRDKPQR